MDPSSTSSFTLFSDSLWFFEILLGIGVLIAVNFIFTKIIKHIRHKTLSTTSSWKEKIDYIFIMPFHILLWLLGITLVIEVLAKRFGFSFFDDYLNAFRSSGVVLCLAWILLRWKKIVHNKFLNRDRRGKKIDAGFVQMISKILSVIIMILAFLIILQIWGLNIVPLIAFGGIGAAVVGFAAKDVIANFFGGLMLYINRPFMVGDFILIPDRNVEGCVEEMGWYLTCVRDKDKRPIYLPNATFSSAHVINSSRMTHRHVEEKIHIQHADFLKLKHVTEKIRSAIAAHPDIDTHLPILVVFHTFTQNHIELYIDFYTLQTRYEKYLALKEEIITLVYEILLQEKMEMRMPPIHVEMRR
ncbi:MAG TPA: mechanosensitive ion channel family protein [Rhabdochlamydiaceae bacterium]|jgi:MscS family membrane protein